MKILLFYLFFFYLKQSEYIKGIQKVTKNNKDMTKDRTWYIFVNFMFYARNNGLLYKQ